MKWPFVSLRVHEAVVADRERIRGERDQFKQDRDQFKRAAESVSEKYADTCITNECLTHDLTAVRERLAEVEAASCDTAATHWRAEARREKKRADQLQKQYDNAVGLKPSRVEDSSRWQPGNQEPKADAS